MASSSTLPGIIISSRDCNRLEQIAESPAWRDRPEAEALLDELARARVVEPEEMPADVVSMRSTVVVEGQDGTHHTLTLSYPDEADISAGKVSVMSSMGSALLGLHVGDSIDWRRPDNSVLRVKVTEIRYQPEASGQYDR